MPVSRHVAQHRGDLCAVPRFLVHHHASLQWWCSLCNNTTYHRHIRKKLRFCSKQQAQHTSPGGTPCHCTKITTQCCIVTSSCCSNEILRISLSYCYLVISHNQRCISIVYHQFATFHNRKLFCTYIRRPCRKGHRRESRLREPPRCASSISKFFSLFTAFV